MLLRIIVTTVCIFLGGWLFQLRNHKPYWYLLGCALLLSLLNAMIFSILKFLANTYIWLAYGFISILLNFLAIFFLEKWMDSNVTRKYVSIFVFALLVSIVSSAAYWLF